MSKVGSARTTRASDVHGRLREDILGGKIAPGARLKYAEVAERYRAASGIVRETLVRLAAEGLVVNEPHQGFMVRALSYADLADLTTARMEIESLVFGLSVESGDLRWESGVVAAHHEMDRTPQREKPTATHPSDAWSAAHRAFHHALLCGCPNRHLLEFATALREEADLYIQWSATYGQEPDRDVRGEHHALMDSALSRDVPRAKRLISQHISHTADLLLSVSTDTRLSADGVGPPAKDAGLESADRAIVKAQSADGGNDV